MLPARILDDLMVCRTRAYYAAHPEAYKPRRIPDMEDSERRGEQFVRVFFSKLKEINRSSSLNEIVKLEDCNREGKKYYLVYSDLEKEISCKPDAILIINIYSKTLRALVLEAAETSTEVILKDKHVIPRILLYMMSSYLYYGVASAGLYVSLSPDSKPPAVLFIQRRTLGGKMVFLERVKELVEATEPPAPKGNPPCSHCVYASICRFRR